MLERAIEIASITHTEQYDGNGSPAIQHALRVLLSGSNDFERICAVLHAAVEESAVSLEYLQEQGFSVAILSVLDCLKKRNYESYSDYLSRIMKNKIACRVKLADLTDHMDILICKPYCEEVEIEKLQYESAIRQIRNALSEIR